MKFPSGGGGDEPDAILSGGSGESGEREEIPPSLPVQSAI